MSLFKKKKQQTKNDCPGKFSLEASANVDLTMAAEGEQKKLPSFSVDAYFGGVVSVNGFPLPIAVDLSGLRSSNVSALLDHDRSMIVGQGTAEISNSKIKITGNITGNTEDSNDPSYKVVFHAKNGFKWPVSIGVGIEKLEYVDVGEKVKCNGKNIEGPSYVVRQGVLQEFSFLSVGADEKASATVNASAVNSNNISGENGMEFEKWLKAMGLKQEDLSQETIVLMQAKFDLEQKTSPAKQQENPTPPSVNASAADDLVEKMRLQMAAEQTRIAGIQAVCGNDYSTICAQAIKEGWTKDRAELEVLKASRPKAPNVGSSQPVDASPLVLEAALCMSAGMPNLEKSFAPNVLEAAHRDYRRMSLQQFLLLAAADAGLSFRPGDRIRNGNLKNVLQAAFSTSSVSGILSNIANKYLLASFNMVEQAWREIASIRSVSDFKAITSYRLIGGGGYEKVGPDGELKHGSYGEGSFTNKADTYGELLSISRQDIINDDLGALTGNSTQKLGRDAGLKLNMVFWTAFLNNSSFFAAGYNNVSASSALSVAGLKKAIGVFNALVDTKGNPIGTIPEILLVPVDLEIDAQQIYNDQFVNEAATAGAPKPSGNPHRGKYKPVSSRYLSNSKITGYSATSYYLLANPMSLPVIEVALLDGKDAPTIETADADFNTLGIQMRGYHDFGVALQDPLGGVRANA